MSDLTDEGIRNTDNALKDVNRNILGRGGSHDLRRRASESFTIGGGQCIGLGGPSWRLLPAGPSSFTRGSWNAQIISMPAL
mmetsp:Transcript_35300/g.110310  ORF Transcript_35300/g.110310 Transcript_35300/m.110310 type:complete len:81 (-) Transcript_35300:151-393(-)